MKVFDLVYTTTNGNFGTQVIANEMWIRAFGQTNLGLGSALAVILFVSVIPVMWINIRRIQQEPVSYEPRDRQPGPPTNGRGAPLYRFLRSIPTWVLWLLVVVWSIPTVGLLVNSVRTRDQQRSTGWWTASARLRRAHARQLPGGPRHDGGRRHEAGTHQLARHRPAGDDHPDRLRRVRRLHVRLDRLQAPPGLFIGTVALLAVPLQVALIPLLLMYVNGAHWTIP